MLVFNSKLLNKMLFDKSISKTELSRRLGVHVQSVVNWTKGHSAPNPFMLIMALREIGLSQEEIASYKLIDFYGAPLTGQSNGTADDKP